MLAARISDAICNEQHSVAEHIVESLSKRASQLLEGFEKVALEFDLEANFRERQQCIQENSGTGQNVSQILVAKERPGKEQKVTDTEGSIARTSRRYRGKKILTLILDVDPAFCGFPAGPNAWQAVDYLAL